MKATICKPSALFSLTKFLFTLHLILLAVSGFCQQGVGIGTSTPHPSAVLDIRDSTRGVLLPRMDSTHRKAISGAKGLMVYDTTTNCLWYHTGNAWTNVSPGGNATGAIQYWDGSRWVNIAPGSPGQFLMLNNDLVPTWGGSGLPVIITTAVSNIVGSSAQSGGNVVSDGGATIIGRGIVWDTVPNPTIVLPTKTSNGTGLGNYTSSLTGLVGNKTYYVRAYATNTNGTNYGNQVNFTTALPVYTIGQQYGGGTVFYIDATGQHGLIAGNQNVTSQVNWGGNATTGATGLNTGTGAANTSIILNAVGNGVYAAYTCRYFYTAGGYNDWFLPSLGELTQMFYQRQYIPGLSLSELPTSNGYAYYWSSSEGGATSAWVLNFLGSSPSQFNLSKTGASGNTFVRAIRAF